MVPPSITNVCSGLLGKQLTWELRVVRWISIANTLKVLWLRFLNPWKNTHWRRSKDCGRFWRSNSLGWQYHHHHHQHTREKKDQALKGQNNIFWEMSFPLLIFQSFPCWEQYLRREFQELPNTFPNQNIRTLKSIIRELRRERLCRRLWALFMNNYYNKTNRNNSFPNMEPRVL